MEYVVNWVALVLILGAGYCLIRKKKTGRWPWER